MNRIKNLLAITAFSLLVLGLPAIASAQWGGQNDPYGRNGGYGNSRNGNYGDIRSTVRDLKQRARNFEQQADRAARYSGRNDRGYGGNGGYGNNNGDRIEDLADRFKSAADDLANAYGRGRNLENSADEARRVLQIGSQIERSMGRSGSAYDLRNEWSQINNDLRIIARSYGYSYNGGGNNRNYPNYPTQRNSGSWRDRIPFPLPF